jgi:hypothetical protein
VRLASPSFAEAAPDVAFDRPNGKVKHRRDLLVRHPLGDVAGDVELARTEAGGPLRGTTRTAERGRDRIGDVEATCFGPDPRHVIAECDLGPRANRLGVLTEEGREGAADTRADAVRSSFSLEQETPAGFEVAAGQVTLSVWEPEKMGLPFAPNPNGVALQ